MKISTRDIATISSLASLQVIINFLPGIPVIGVDGAKIGLVSSVVPLFGFLLGPWLGAATALVGSIVSRVLTGATIFSWLLLPTMPLSAFFAGCLTRRKVGVFKGWIVSTLILGGLIFAWYNTWISRSVLVYPLLHWVGIAIILIFREWLSIFYKSGSKSELTICIGLCGFSSSMVAHMYGTLAFIVASELAFIPTSLIPEFFLGLIPIVAIERFLITLIITVLGVPITLSFRKKPIIQAKSETLRLNI